MAPAAPPAGPTYRYPTDADVFPPGSRWLEGETGRVIVIHSPGPNSPWWYYEDDPGPLRPVHYCCVEDFTIWRRFTPLFEYPPLTTDPITILPASSGPRPPA